jgi:hypothetical protein
MAIDTAVVAQQGGNNTFTGTNTFVGPVDASGASMTKTARVVGADPSGACTNNNEVVVSSATGNLFTCLTGTWHAAGGGGGSSLYSYTTTVGAAITGCAGAGQDCIIAMTPATGTGSLPALAANKCFGYTMTFVSNQVSNITPKLWFGSGMTLGGTYTTGSSLVSDAAGVNPSPMRFSGVICNNNATTAAQTATLITEFHQGNGGYATTGSMAQAAGSTGLQIGISVNPVGVEIFTVLVLTVSLLS